MFIDKYCLFNFIVRNSFIKNLYLFNSFQKESFKTKIKAKILSPKIVKLEKLKNNMAKIQLNHDEKLISGWIIIDESVWGLFDEEIN